MKTKKGEKSFTIKCNKCGRKMTLKNKFVFPKKNGIKIYKDWYGDVPDWYVFKCGCGNKVEEY